MVEINIYMNKHVYMCINVYKCIDVYMTDKINLSIAKNHQAMYQTRQQ